MNTTPDDPLTPAHYLSRLLGLMTALVLLAGLANFLIDPLQVFRKASFYPAHFSDNERYQAPGLARHYAAPVVVVGTSHMENMTPGEIEAAFQTPGLRLALSGSSLTEQALALSLALETGRVRRVVWGIDYAALAWGDRLVEEWGEFPIYLYQFDPRLLSRYLLSMQTLAQGVEALATPPTQTLDTLNTWWRTARFGPDRVRGAWQYQEDRWTPELRARVTAVTHWPELRAVLEKRLFAVTRAHPDIRFDLVLPPYSILGYANDFRVSDEWFFQRMLMRHELREFAATAKNVRLWDFQTERAITEDFSHYKDLEHYDMEVARLMLNRIAHEEPPSASGAPDLLPLQVAQRLRPSCAGSGEAALCTRFIRCGQSRLEAWLAAGQSEEHALEFAHHACSP